MRNRTSFSDKSFEGHDYSKIEGLVLRVVDGINAGVGWCVACGFDTGFDGGAYGYLP